MSTRRQKADSCWLERGLVPRGSDPATSCFEHTWVRRHACFSVGMTFASELPQCKVRIKNCSDQPRHHLADPLEKPGPKASPPMKGYSLRKPQASRSTKTFRVVVSGVPGNGRYQFSASGLIVVVYFCLRISP